MPVPAGAFVLMLALQAPGTASDSLRGLASSLPESALVLEARSRPAVVRDAFEDALRQSVRDSAMEGLQLDIARKLAAAHAAAWSDSFFMRELAQFTRRSHAHRVAKITADSMRRAGTLAFGRDGPVAARAIWRRALSRSRALADTASIAAVLGNIGTSFLAESRTDSAITSFERARRLAIAAGDRRVEANALSGLAEVAAARQEIELARDRHTQARTLHESIGDVRGVAADENNLGLLAEQLGDLTEARRRFEAALELHRKSGRDDLAATNLINLAALAAADGDFARATQLYADALVVWRGRQDWASAADALHGLGQLELRRGDYVAGRKTLLEAKRIYDRTGPLDAALGVRRDLARALMAVGDPQAALDTLRAAERLAIAGGAGALARADVVLTRADLAVTLNAPAEAAQLYARAERLYRDAGDAAGMGAAQEGRALLLLERNDHPAARALMLSALRTQTTSGDRRAIALARLSYARVLREQGDMTTARQQVTRALADLERLNDPVAVASGLHERAELDRLAGMPSAADSVYRVALERLAGRVAPDVAWELHAGRAAALRLLGNMEGAARELRAALVEIERPSRSFVLAERRAAFLADKSDVYAQLATVEVTRGHPAAAFDASERLRAREMLEMLARGRIGPSADAPARLVDREQDLRRHMAELTRDSEDEGSGGALRGPQGAARAEALEAAQSAYAELLLEMREASPRHADLVVTRSASWRDVAARLAPGETFVEYLVGDSATLAFAVTADTLRVVEVRLGHRELARLIEFARGALHAPAPRPRADELWRSALRRLHAQLVEPLEEGGLLDGTMRLIVAPHAELHYLPLAALIDGGGRFLVERYDIAQTPSASVWLALGDRAIRPASGTLLLGPRAESLRGTQREIAALARRATGAMVLTGASATEAAFRREAPDRKIVHLASYGVLNKQNPLFSYVELAPAADDDGRLEVHEVFGLSLAADLVVLSACQTALGSGALADVPSGDDWIGLTRAFLHAGARSVVATLWPVDDLATARFMELFYDGMAAGAEPTRALALAQRQMLAASSTAHPFYWAGFVVVTGRGRRDR